MLRCLVFDLCRMLTYGERRNDFAVWTVRTHLFRVRRSSHFPSSLPSSTTTSLELHCCAGLSVRDRPLRSKGHYGTPVHRSNGPLRDVRPLCARVLANTDKRPHSMQELRLVVHATSSGPLWCNGTGLQLWSVVCGVRGLFFYTSHATASPNR